MKMNKKEIKKVIFCINFQQRIEIGLKFYRAK